MTTTPDTPRTWALPDEPGPEVTAVRDALDEIWIRATDGCWRPTVDEVSFSHAEWPALLSRGPLTDVTAEHTQAEAERPTTGEG